MKHDSEYFEKAGNNKPFKTPIEAAEAAEGTYEDEVTDSQEARLGGFPKQGPNPSPFVLGPLKRG